MGLTYDEAVRAGIGHLHPASAPALSPSPGVWVVTVPNWHPTKLNDLIGKSHWVESSRKKKDRAVIAAAFAGVPPATGKRRISLLITLAPRKRGADIDAYWKACLDGMKRAGVIKDDTHFWAEITPVKYERGAAAATTVTVEDIFQGGKAC